MLLLKEIFQFVIVVFSSQVLSSPVRDLNQALCRLTFGEAVVKADVYNDKSVKSKLSMQSFNLEESGKNASSFVRK